ncbi:TetR family transcriptional regulator [Williamsia limnetica]|uniref:TetR family transcriptional regulator n=2 Tax=Williamsia limnetica TaxID=882452 RepID=A0A318RLK0_WILLI|nr:TetR family transcriptional regulator [Williamsia limnetica]
MGQKCTKLAVMTATHPAAETGARERTRRAILDAAVVVLAKSPTAPLSEIADRARVGRTTLHRYFPERGDLLAAVGRYGEQAMAEAGARADLASGDGLDAVLRLCQEYFELSDVLTVAFFAAGINDQDICFSDSTVVDAVERGRHDGSIDRELDAAWIINMMWAVLYASVDHVNTGAAGRMKVQSMTLRSVRKAIAAQQ